MCSASGNPAQKALGPGAPFGRSRPGRCTRPPECIQGPGVSPSVSAPVYWCHRSAGGTQVQPASALDRPRAVRCRELVWMWWTGRCPGLSSAVGEESAQCTIVPVCGWENTTPRGGSLAHDIRPGRMWVLGPGNMAPDVRWESPIGERVPHMPCQHWCWIGRKRWGVTVSLLHRVAGCRPAPRASPFEGCLLCGETIPYVPGWRSFAGGCQAGRDGIKDEPDTTRRLSWV